MVERCRTPELVIEPEHFALKIQHIVLSVKATAFTLSAVRISDVLTEVLKGVQASHVKMEGDFVNTILSILLLEGIGRQLDPALDLFKSALPILRQVGGRMGTKEAIAAVPGNDLGAMLKVCFQASRQLSCGISTGPRSLDPDPNQIWLYLEARQFAASVKVDWDTWIKYDRLTPNV
jgi:aarF domain-containing kinase